MLRQPSRGRLIFLLVVGIVIVVIEGLILAVFIAAGEVSREPLARGVIPVALLIYGLYLVISSTRKLRRGSWLRS